MSVRLIRMAAGEEVVADIIEETDTTITLCDPIVAVPTQNNQIGFAPWAPFVDKSQKEIVVSKQFVIYTANVAEEIATQYNTMFSKIITPSSPILR